MELNYIKNYGPKLISAPAPAFSGAGAEILVCSTDIFRISKTFFSYCPKTRFKRSIFSNLRILVNIIDHVGRQGQYIDIKEATIMILTQASIISNDFDIIDTNCQYSERLT